MIVRRLAGAVIIHQSLTLGPLPGPRVSREGEIEPGPPNIVMIDINIIIRFTRLQPDPDVIRT